MALRPVLQFPDPKLKRESTSITEVTDAIRELARDMIEVMYDEPGIGLAAPQVGEAIRLVVMDTDWTDDDADRDPKVMVNPEILEKDGEVIWNEGCLSVPDFQADVKRASRVKVRYHDLDGNEVIEEAEELRAVCFQHEIDHLDGILYIDRISRLKRTLYVKKRRKAMRDEEEDAPATMSASRSETDDDGPESGSETGGSRGPGSRSETGGSSGPGSRSETGGSSGPGSRSETGGSSGPGSRSETGGSSGPGSRSETGGSSGPGSETGGSSGPGSRSETGGSSPSA